MNTKSKRIRTRAGFGMRDSIKNQSYCQFIVEHLQGVIPCLLAVYVTIKQALALLLVT